MRAGSYYALAAVLVLATVPMYRYIFQRARELDRPQETRVVYAVSAPVSYVPPPPRPEARTPLALLPGELCEGGVVVIQNGNAYTQAGSPGHPLACSGRFAYP
jgi:hypothetical protein